MSGPTTCASVAQPTATPWLEGQGPVEGGHQAWLPYGLRPSEHRPDCTLTRKKLLNLRRPVLLAGTRPGKCKRLTAERHTAHGALQVAGCKAIQKGTAGSENSMHKKEQEEH